MTKPSKRKVQSKDPNEQEKPKPSGQTITLYKIAPPTIAGMKALLKRMDEYNKLIEDEGEVWEKDQGKIH